MGNIGMEDKDVGKLLASESCLSFWITSRGGFKRTASNTPWHSSRACPTLAGEPCPSLRMRELTEQAGKSEQEGARSLCTMQAWREGKEGPKLILWGN